MRSSSASRPARASSLLLAALLALAPAQAPAQWAGEPSGGVIVVDLDRAMRDSAAAAALRSREIEERRALRTRLDALQASLEAEEAELTELRDDPNLDRAAFDERVQKFDQRVRGARRSAQEEAAALQARFAEAERALREMMVPLIDALRRERGAALVLERQAILSVRDELDATADLIARIDDAQPGLDGLLAPP